MDPCVGIEAIITRSDPRNQFPGVFWPEQAISLEKALRIYTIEGAKAMTLGEITGSVEVGKPADMIVLNHDLFKISQNKNSDTRIEATYFEGEQAYPLSQ